jgi:excisionase family DNA binding protein
MTGKDTIDRATQLTVQQAADMLGVHYMTAYRYIRTGRLPATRVGNHWHVRPADLARIAPKAAPGRNTATRTTRAPGKKNYVRQLVPLLVQGDESEAWRLVQAALVSAYTPENLYLDVLGPAMHRIGTEWAAGRLDVAAEHRATVVMYRLVGRLGPLFARPGTTRGRVVLGAPAGDPHGLATALVADPLRGRGFSITDLGANTPPASWANALAGTTQRIVGVGVVVSTSVDDTLAAATIATIKTQHEVPVVLGGVAIADQAHAERLGADIWTTSARQAVDRFDTLHA